MIRRSRAARSPRQPSGRGHALASPHLQLDVELLEIVAFLLEVGARERVLVQPDARQFQLQRAFFRLEVDARRSVGSGRMVGQDPGVDSAGAGRLFRRPVSRATGGTQRRGRMLLSVAVAADAQEQAMLSGAIPKPRVVETRSRGDGRYCHAAAG